MISYTFRHHTPSDTIHLTPYTRPPAAGETPDPCHLSGPEMISYTFRHHTPSDTIHLGLPWPWGAAGAMDVSGRTVAFTVSYRHGGGVGGRNGHGGQHQRQHSEKKPAGTTSASAAATGPMRCAGLAL